MEKWFEKEKRSLDGTSVSTLLNDSVLERNRTYIRAVAEVIQFLAVNELPFRG